MVNMPGHRAPVGRRADRADLLRSAHSRGERIGRWTLRLVLPVAAGFAIQLVYWMWFDNPYGRSLGSIVGGFLIAVTALAAALWAWHAWFSKDCF
jgi:hypothetical protein